MVSYARLGVVVSALLGASIAALFAHVAIDIIGDYVLPHDAYDDLVHDSRVGVFAVILVLASAAALRFIWNAVDAGARSACTARARLAAAVPRRPLCFVAAVCGLALVVVALMGALDASFSRVPIDDPADVFGGSFLLGIGTTLACALAVALGTWQFARWLAGARAAIVRAVAAFVLARTRVSTRAVATRDRLEPRPPQRTAIVRRASKRGPPLLV